MPTCASPKVLDILCTCHLVSLSVKAATKTIPIKVDEFLADIYYHFHHSVKRIEYLKDFADFCSTEYKSILKHCETQWLFLTWSIKRILEMWEPLCSYFFSHPDVENPGKVKTIVGLLSQPPTKAWLLFLSNILRCYKCFGPLTVSENLSVRRELVSRIAIECNRPECNSSAYITDSYNDAAKKVNTMSILRMHMIERARAGLETFLSFMNLPPPVTWHGYSAYMEEIARTSLQQAQKIREAASEHLYDMHGVKKDDLLDITVTCDGTWSKRGFTAMYGVVVVASWEMGF